MAERRPLVIVGDSIEELPAGDTLPGAAAASHTHSASDITSGTLSDARLPTTMGGKVFTGAVHVGIGPTWKGIELSAHSTNAFSYIDFHTNNTTYIDSDARIFASGSSADNTAYFGATLGYQAASHSFIGPVGCDQSVSAKAGLFDRGGTGPDTSPALRARAGGYSIGFYPRLGPGNHNPMVQTGDSALVYDAGADSGALVIGQWSSTAKGLRIAADGVTTFSHTPTFPTAPPGDNSTKGATTAFVQSAITPTNYAQPSSDLDDASLKWIAFNSSDLIGGPKSGYVNYLMTTHKGGNYVSTGFGFTHEGEVHFGFASGPSSSYQSRTWTWRKIWHEGNDGAGSGLDADLLDGQHASSFAQASHTHDLSALTQSGATTGQVPQWNGTAWVPSTVAGGGGGGLVWQTVTVNTTMASGNGYNADGALNMSLPLTISTGDRFAVHALGSTVTVLRNGNTITYKGTDVADDVTLAPGETIWLVATAADVVEIV